METEAHADGPQAAEAHADGQDRQPSEALIDAVDQLLDEVEGALARLDDGSYGSCESCGGTVEDERLAATPTALQCQDSAAVTIGWEDTDEPAQTEMGVAGSATD